MTLRILRPRPKGIGPTVEGMTTHDYGATLTWSGSTAVGHRSFRRSHTAALTSRTELELSADAAFRGDVDLPNPEQLVVAAASSCQLLSFLGAAARAGVDVVAYSDSARGEMPGVGQSGGNASRVSITEIELRPVIRVRDADPEKVKELVVRAHDQCYVANSLRSKVNVTPTIEVVA